MVAMRPAKVVVAMSGGVDSSVAAALLVREGHDVIGVTLDIWPEDESHPNQGAGCCGWQAAEEARRVCHALDIPHYVLNFRDVFAEAVIGDFCREYGRGRTPNPCIRCNEWVKFVELMRRAELLEARYVATGHYARIVRSERGRFSLRKAVDCSKDQSYVLYMLDQAAMARLLFPVGEMTKEAVRAEARRLGLRVADRPESQEICFVAPGRQAELVRARGAGTGPGEVVTLGGEVVGRHGGLEEYTIGQRKGIGAHADGPKYVVALDAASNRVLIGEDADLRVCELVASGARWCDVEPRAPLAVAAKVRYNMEESPATIESVEEGTVRVRFLEPQRAITPGQAIVFYDGWTVLGGATIDAAVRS